MEKDYLILKRASVSRSSGEWNDADYDVLAAGTVVGRILKVHAAPVGTPWMWTLAFGHHQDHTPTHGYEATREARWPHLPKAGAAHEKEKRPPCLGIRVRQGTWCSFSPPAFLCP